MGTVSRKKFLIVIGNLSSNFDAALYGFLAPLFSQDFFPNDENIMSLIFAYAAMGVSFLARPAGAAFAVRLVWRYGPQLSLSYVLYWMGIVTLSIVFIPTYNKIGILSPILIVIYRLGVGFTFAMESAIAIPYMAQSSYDTKKGFGISLYCISQIVGILLASFCAWLIMPLPYLWRIPFVIATAVSITGAFLRKYAIMDLDINKMPRPNKMIEWVDVKKSLRIFIGICLLELCGYLTHYFTFVFFNVFAPLVANATYESMMGFNTILLVFDLCILIVWSTFIDKLSHKKVVLYCLLGMISFTIPAFMFIKGASLAYLIFIRVVIITLGAPLYVCTLSTLFDRLKNDSVTKLYGLLGLGGQTSAMLMMHYVSGSLWLYKITGSPLAPAIHFTVIACLALVGYFLITVKKL